MQKPKTKLKNCLVWTAQIKTVHGGHRKITYAYKI